MHPSSALSGNGRANRWARYEASKASKRQARGAMRAQLAQVPATAQHEIKSAVYFVDWYYKGTCPDDDNVITRMKYARDGIAEALGINDRIMRIGAIRPHHDKGRAGTVTVTVRLYDFEQEGGEG